jgi:hypothetical protein
MAKKKKKKITATREEESEDRETHPMGISTIFM